MRPLFLAELFQERVLSPHEWTLQKILTVSSNARLFPVAALPSGLLIYCIVYVLLENTYAHFTQASYNFWCANMSVSYNHWAVSFYFPTNLTIVQFYRSWIAAQLQGNDWHGGVQGSSVFFPWRKQQHVCSSDVAETRRSHDGSHIDWNHGVSSNVWVSTAEAVGLHFMHV